MKIGTFTYDKASDTYSGDIRTLTNTRTGLLVRPASPRNDREPDYQIVLKDERGEADIGAAWKKQSDRRDYLSVVLDDPAFPTRINAAIFPSRDGRSAELVWTRPQQRPDEPARPGREKRGRREPGQAPSI